MIKKNKHIKKYILLTLGHCEQSKFINPEYIYKQITTVYKVKATVIAKEYHKDHTPKKPTYHYHTGIFSEDIQSRTVIKILKSLFNNYLDESQIHISKTHRNFTTICNYITKFDKKPKVWGITLEEVLKLAEKAKKQGKRADKINDQVYQNTIIRNKAEQDLAYKAYEELKQTNNWVDALDNKALIGHLMRNYISVQKYWYAIQQAKPIPTAINATMSYLQKHLKYISEPKVYTVEDVGELRYQAIYWLYQNIFFSRPFKKKQLYLWGETNTGKSELINAVNEDYGGWLKCCEIQFVGKFVNGISTDNVHLYYSPETRIDNTNVNEFKKFLEGQGLYNVKGASVKKENNNAVILLSNEYPTVHLLRNSNHARAIDARVEEIQFKQSTVPKITIDKLRLAFTFFCLWLEDYITHTANAEKNFNPDMMQALTTTHKGILKKAIEGSRN